MKKETKNFSKQKNMHKDCISDVVVFTLVNV